MLSKRSAAYIINKPWRHGLKRFNSNLYYSPHVCSCFRATLTTTPTERICLSLRSTPDMFESSPGSGMNESLYAWSCWAATSRNPGIHPRPAAPSIRAQQRVNVKLQPRRSYCWIAWTVTLVALSDLWCCDVWVYKIGCSHCFWESVAFCL